jgi:hypothetical protein
MPDHLHVIATPTEDREARVGDFSSAIKRWMRKEIQKSGKRNAYPTTADWQWQPGCFDRLLRSDVAKSNAVASPMPAFPPVIKMVLLFMIATVRC